MNKQMAKMASDENRRATWFRRLFIVWAILFTLAVGYAIRGLREVTQDNKQQAKAAQRLAEEGQQAHLALCVFKLDLGRRADVGAQFLKDHPHGIPGIPASVLVTSVNNQRATYRSLKVLKCDELKGR